MFSKYYGREKCCTEMLGVLMQCVLQPRERLHRSQHLIPVAPPDPSGWCPIPAGHT